MVASVAALSACYEGIPSEDWYGDSYGDPFGDGTETGDDSAMQGDGDPVGDGDGDPPPGDGDGDPTPGDGDGDPTPGDGDGDPPPGDGDGDPPPGDGDGDPPPGDGDGDGDPSPLPDNAYCNPVSNWNASWVAAEDEVLVLVNQARAQGGNCDSQGVFAPSGPLTWHAALTCAARVHSKDMADNNFFDHTNLQGNGPGWRLGQAGYNGGGWGENIAAGYQDPASVVQGWLDSDGHCANMLNPSFSLIGVGYASGPGEWTHYWTQTFGN